MLNLNTVKYVYIKTNDVLNSVISSWSTFFTVNSTRYKDTRNKNEFKNDKKFSSMP